MSFLVNLFLPHHGNNHKAHFIKSHSIFALSFVFIFFQFFLNFLLVQKPDVLGYSANISPERIIDLTNNERAKLGLAAVKQNRLLSEAARQKAADMFAFNYWAHVSPSGRTPWSFFSDVGYRYQYAGENLARDFRDPDSIVTAWMNSPSHRENVVNPKYQEIGVAVVDGTLQGTETTLVVQLFGTSFGAVKPADKPKPAVQPAQKPAIQSEPAEEEQPIEIPIEENIPAEVPIKVVEPIQFPNSQLVFSNREILAKSTGNEIPITNPLDLTKFITIFIVGILIGVFAADTILVSHQHTPRFSSRSIAQMMFLIFIMGVTLLIRQGAIL